GNTRHQFIGKVARSGNNVNLSPSANVLELPIDSELFSSRCKRTFPTLHCQLSTDAQHQHRRPAYFLTAVMHLGSGRHALSESAYTHVKRSPDHMGKIFRSRARSPRYFQWALPLAQKLAGV